MRRGIAILSVVLLSSVAFGERQPYSRYQSIVDRQMFGVPPPGFDPTKPPSEVSRGDSRTEKELTKEQEKLKSSIVFSVINVTPEGETAVGFTDKSNPKVPCHYYLRVGEERDGWTVKEADAAAKSMTIARGELEVSLLLGGDSSKQPDATGRTGAANAAVPAVASSGGSTRSSLLNSLRGRRASREQRLEKEKQAFDEEKKRFEEERARREAHEKRMLEQERAESQQQLRLLADELRKTRESVEKAKETAAGGAEREESAPPEETMDE